MGNPNVRISNGSALNNPNVSEEVKAHVVDQDVGDDQTHKQKDLTNVAAWPKASVVKAIETAIVMC
jgi:hypothetical protein